MAASEPGAAARFDRWVQQRLPAWRQLDAALPALEDDRPVSAEAALAVLRQYPEIARDLAIARRAAPASRIAGHLQHTYGRLYRVLLREPRPPLRERAAALLAGIPRVVIELRGHIAAVTAWFVLAALAGWWLVATYPELVSLFASERMIESVHGGRLWTDDLLNVAPSSLVSIGIFTNNIVVALTALSLGLFYGLGTLYIIGLNGLMLGGVFAFTARHGLAGRLFEFVCAHGFVELSVICLAGAVGLYVGESLARPGARTRIELLQLRMARGARVMALCILFLVGAGVIEGYVSPDAGFGLGARLAVGVGYLVLFLWGLAGFRVRRAAAPGAADSAPAGGARVPAAT